MGWVEEGTFNADGEKASVRLWKHTDLRRKRQTPPGLTRYAIQVFAGEQCRQVDFNIEMNFWTRHSISRWGTYRTGFYEVGFMDAKQNTPGAAGREKWAIQAIVSPVEECPGERDSTTTNGIIPQDPNQSPFDRNG